MRDPVQIIHDGTDRITTVPRGTVDVLAKSGWRLLADIPVIDISTLDGPETLLVGEDQIIHVGGGWYELPNGEHVQGRDNALAALDG